MNALEWIGAVALLVVLLFVVLVATGAIKVEAEWSDRK